MGAPLGVRFNHAPHLDYLDLKLSEQGDKALSIHIFGRPSRVLLRYHGEGRGQADALCALVNGNA